MSEITETKNESLQKNILVMDNNKITIDPEEIEII